jgi:K+ transporter
MLCIAWFFSVCPDKFPDSNLKNIKPAFSTALEIHHLPIYSNIIACRTIITLEYNLTRQVIYLKNVTLMRVRLTIPALEKQ